MNPDRALRRLAISRDWPVLDFTETGGLAERTRFSEVRRPAVAATALGAGLAAAGVAPVRRPPAVRLAKTEAATVLSFMKVAKPFPGRA